MSMCLLSLPMKNLASSASFGKEPFFLFFCSCSEPSSYKPLVICMLLLRAEGKPPVEILWMKGWSWNINLKVFLEWSLTEGQIELMNDSFRIDWTHPWCPLSPPLPCMSPRSPVWGQLQRVTSAQEKVSGWGLAEQEQVHVVFCKTNSSANICLGSSSAMPVPYFTRDQQSHEKRKFWMLSWALQ